VEHLGYRGYKRMGGGRRVHLAGEDLGVGNLLAVKGLRIFLVLVDVVSGEIEASEEAFAAGIGEELRVG